MARPRTPGGRARITAERLAGEYPGDAADLCELSFSSPWELLVATVLSAQTTDVRVNMVTPGLFARYPAPPDLAAADPTELEEMIRSTGFYRNKAHSLLGLAHTVVDRFDGRVPTAMADMVTLPGVGRKTANVVRSVALGQPGFPVDTHVTRLVGLLRLSTEVDPVRIEAEVGAMLPRAQWGAFSLRMILHGRRVCVARRPRCEECVLADFCPSSLVPTRSRTRRGRGSAAGSPP